MDERTLFGWIVFFYLTLALIPALVAPLEWKLYDLVSRREAVDQVPDPSLVVVGIDAQTLDWAGQSWPWGPDLWRAVLARLRSFSPQCIVVTLPGQFAFGTDHQPLPAWAEGLIDTNPVSGRLHPPQRAQVGPVPVMIRVLSRRDDLAVEAVAAAASAAADLGCVDERIYLVPESDNLIRRVSVPGGLVRGMVPTMASAATEAWPSRWLAFRKGGGGIPVWSLAALMREPRDAAELRGKRVIVGLTAPILHHVLPMPTGLLTGPEALAHGLDTFLAGRRREVAIGFLCGLVGVLLGSLASFVMFSANGAANVTRAGGMTVVCFSAYVVSTQGLGLYWTPLSFTAGLWWSMGCLQLLEAFQRMVEQALFEGETRQVRELQELFAEMPPWPSPQGVEIFGEIKFGRSCGNGFIFQVTRDRHLFFILGGFATGGFVGGMLTTQIRAELLTLLDEPDVNSERLAEYTARLATSSRKFLPAGSAAEIALGCCGPEPFIDLHIIGNGFTLYSHRRDGATNRLPLPGGSHRLIQAEAPFLLHWRLGSSETAPESGRSLADLDSFARDLCAATAAANLTDNVFLVVRPIEAPKISAA